MIETVLAELRKALPLRVARAEWNDPVLILAGDGWTFTINSPWRVASEAALRFGCWDGDAGGRLSELRNRDIVAVHRQAVVVPLDPVFEMSNAVHLEVFSVEATEPWVLRIHGNTFVASPSDSGAFSRG